MPIDVDGTLEGMVLQGADVTSLVEFEPALSGQRLIPLVKQGEALAMFERNLVSHLQQISKALALYARALLGEVSTRSLQKD